MKLRILLPIFLLLATALAVGYLLREDAPETGVDPAPIPPVAASAPPSAPVAPTSFEPPDATNLLYREPSPEALEQLMAHPEARAAMDAYRKQEMAAARFSQAVDDGNYEVGDLNRSVVSFFKTMELEPVLDDDAMILGLEVRHIYENSPLRKTDLVEGDLITKINDERLYDPADVPGLFEGLERDLRLCVDRDGSEVCSRIALD